MQFGTATCPGMNHQVLEKPEKGDQIETNVGKSSPNSGIVIGRGDGSCHRFS